ncbi:acylneuraminate cytidylyltransferase family protein [Flavicella marina]|uniref:acylneuraminate cytidylyltransferase family protein n=1 Tax=Flavicella marina TaxID=1475951 RepID=UPI001263F6F1|nr:acylneuraminate cytidylyltransferase family protein [Flavicella marina]
MKVLGLIPARGGSKGVPQKNIRLVDGLPLIGYSIEIAKKSKLLTDVVVSTDSDEIIDVVKSLDCSFLKRSSKNAQDESKIETAILEVLETLETNYDLIVLLQPTSPIREVEDIDNVIKMLVDDEKLDSVVSLVELEDIHPARMYQLSEAQKMLPLQPDLERKRRQDLKPVYLRNGAIYATRVSTFLKSEKFIADNKKGYVMPESKWSNVDTERDLLITEALIKEWKKGNL